MHCPEAATSRARTLAEGALLTVLGSNHQDSESLRLAFDACCQRLFKRLAGQVELTAQVRERCNRLANSIPHRTKAEDCAARRILEKTPRIPR